MNLKSIAAFLALSLYSMNSSATSIRMPDFTQNFLMELLALLLFGLFYLVLRYLIIRRPITYPEYEKFFFVSISVVAIFALAFFIFLGD